MRALSHHSAADTKKLDDFYRMLDKERKDWYNQQIEEEAEPPKQEEPPKQSKRQFDLFDESSSESEYEKTQLKDALSK